MRFAQFESLFVVVTTYPEHDMVKPSIVSVGMGIGALLLGGSGIAIPTLWSHANQVETDRDELRDSLREARKARVVTADAQHAATQKCDALEEQIVTHVEDLASAQESNRILTSQLAKMQAHDRDLMAASGTLKLRDLEMADLRQQLEQTRSDNDALVARRDGVGAKGDETRPSDGEVAAVDLAPVPQRETTPRKEASGKSQSAAKPATEPIRFDDSGWKSVTPKTVYGFPSTNQISPSYIIAP